METNLLIIILVAVVIVTLLFFFMRRNNKDRKDLEHELIKGDEVPVRKEEDTEINAAEEK